VSQTSDRINKLGPGTCEYIVADLKDKAGCDALCAELKKRTDRLTVLINNSGATWYASSYFEIHEEISDGLIGVDHMTISQKPAGISSWL
jgi:NAD(P)-dependent dehydrogenase (short-subunit alcohol dehydrogenase family)